MAEREPKRVDRLTVFETRTASVRHRFRNEGEGITADDWVRFGSDNCKCKFAATFTTICYKIRLCAAKQSLKIKKIKTFSGKKITFFSFKIQTLNFFLNLFENGEKSDLETGKLIEIRDFLTKLLIKQ
ncbi:hypothetical protein V6Z12_A08G007200 [Gossypium hirsutum]